MLNETIMQIPKTQGSGIEFKGLQERKNKFQKY